MIKNCSTSFWFCLWRALCWGARGEQWDGAVGAFGQGQRGTAAWHKLCCPEKQAGCPLGCTVSHHPLALQALWDFPHTTCAIPPDYLLDLIPRIRPRAFSIASSMLVRAQPFLASCQALSRRSGQSQG